MKDTKIKLFPGEVLVKYFCPCCETFEDFPVFLKEDMKIVEEAKEKGFFEQRCEPCYYRSYSNNEEDSGRYSPIDVHGLKGLL